MLRKCFICILNLLFYKMQSYKPEQIHIIDILKAVDENKKCVMHDKWKEPKKSVLDMFKKTSLKDIT